MTGDKYRPPETADLSPERLDDSLFRFADLLSGYRWDKRKTHGVSISRSMTDYRKETATTEESTKRTKLSFKADKTGGLGEVEFGTPRYVISSTVTQDVYLEDLPDNIRQETVDEAYQKGHPLRKVLKEFGVDADPEPDVIYDTLDSLSLTSREKVKFVIADGGEVIRHNVSHRYSYEDVTFLSAAYSSSTGSMDWHRLDRPKGFAVELRPANLEDMSQDEQTRENEIRRQAEGLDTELERYFFQESVTEMLRIRGRPSEDAVRQILGMLAMISTDMKRYKL